MERPQFKITVDRHNLPLIIWNNPPGLYAEFTPDQLLLLAYQLRQIADVAMKKT
jgi:hypothetical protein